MSIAEQLYLDSLRQSQWLPPEQLAQYQRPLLENLVRHAARHTDFYPDRLRPVFDAASPNDRPIDWSRWHEVPILRRSHAIDYFDALKAREVPPEAGRTAESMSSGSTGRPLKHLRSALGDMAANCILDRACELHGMDMFGSLAMIIGDTENLYPYPHGMKKKRWNRTAPEADLFVLSTATAPSDALEWLERMRPNHLMTYPVTLREIADLALARGGTSLKAQTFLSTGEVLDADARASIGEAFGCKIVDIYGAREIGQIAFQCPDGDGYHLSSEAVLCELLDDDGNEVGSGEFGRVVVTPYYNYAMPFIRYDLGDYARRSIVPCRCGRGLPSIDAIGGRARNLYFAMPGGARKRFRNLQITHKLGEEISCRYIQFIQTAVDALEIRFVPIDPSSGPDREKAAAIEDFLRGEFHRDLKVTLVPVDRIERGAGHKYEIFISRVA